MKKKDKEKVLDFLRGELPIEDLESDILTDLAEVARNEYVEVSAANLELTEKITDLEKQITDLNKQIEDANTGLEEATNRVKEYEELEKIRVSEQKETLLALIKNHITELGLKIPEPEEGSDEESIFSNLENCQIETLEQIKKILSAAETSDLTGLQQTKPEGDTEEDHNDDTSEKTKPGDALPDNSGSEEPKKKPHETLVKLRGLIDRKPKKGGK